LNDGVSAINIAQGALEQLGAIITRQLELSTQAANGTLQFAQRRALNAEANALGDEYNRIIASTRFNGRSLIDLSSDTSGAIRFQGGYGVQGGISADLARQLGIDVFNGSLSSTLVNSTPNQLGSFASGDFNGDGLTDVIISGNIDGTTLLRSNGDGTFTSSSLGGFGVSGFAAADVNGDGRLDLVTGGASGARVRLGNGDGTFAAGITVGSGSVTSVQIGDLNGDGVPDIIAKGSGSNVLTFTGNGNGTFQTGSTTTLAASSTIVLADLNGDGRTDIISNNGTNLVSRLGNGDGTFGGLSSQNIGGASSIANPAFSDLNGDGFLDIVASTSSGIVTAFGNGNGTFGASASYSIDSMSPSRFSLTDVNGDGVADIVGAAIVDNLDGNQSGRGFVMLANRDGSFNSATIAADSGVLDVAPAALGVVIADFNNDGTSDIFSLFNTTDTISSSSTLTILGETQTSNVARLDLFTAASARATLSTLSEQLNRINRQLGVIGASQSRLNTALNVLSVTSEQFLAADSRIRDVDIANESAELTRQGILQRAAAGILAQSNQQPSIALELLR
jgi:flagellin-like hook-associated protein FlgL